MVIQARRPALNPERWRSGHFAVSARRSRSRVDVGDLEGGTVLLWHDEPVGEIANRLALTGVCAVPSTSEYLQYSLGDHHPTRPVRAQNLVRLVQEAGLPHRLASMIVGGTLEAARHIRDGHAQRDTASGCCIYNDMAAAKELAGSGLKVLFVDWDAHHGDGVEFLLEEVPHVMTASIHNGAIFPGTGQRHRPEANAYN